MRRERRSAEVGGGTASIIAHCAEDPDSQSMLGGIHAFLSLQKCRF